jgi:hypothetical protein
MIPRALLTFCAALVVGLVFVASTAPVAAETVIESSTVVNGYPRTLTFKVTAKADADITDVTLRYSIKGRGTSALDKPKDLTPAKNLSAEVVLQTNSSGNYIPVGSDFVYHWEITTADGNTSSGPEQSFFYLPPDKDWQNVANEFMTVYYHGARQQIADAYLKAGTETYERIGKGLYNVTLKQLPVKVIIFADEKESDLARPGSGGRFDAAVTTCGTKVTNDILLVIPVACGSADRTDTLRHELGHILNETAGEGALGKLPSWLDEGAAVYAQSSPGDYATAFNTALRSNSLIPFSQMGQPPSNANAVGVFYGQSWAMVSYLIEKSGPDKFREFMSTIKTGQRFDQALKTVYGFADLAAFESEFKGAVGGAPPQRQPTTAPTAAPTQRQQQAQPTRAPTSAPAQTANGGDDDSGIGTGTIVIGGVAVLFIFGAVFAFLISMMMANNRKAATTTGSASAGEPGDWRPPDAPA